RGRAHCLVDVLHDGSLNDPGEAERAHNPRSSDRSAERVAHPELHGNGAPTLEHARPVGVDRLKDLMPGSSIARAAPGIANGLLERAAARLESSTPGVARRDDVG